MSNQHTLFHRSVLFFVLAYAANVSAQTTATQTNTGSTSKPAAIGSQPSTCEGAFAAFGVSLPTGVTASQVCPSITTAVNDSVQALTQNSGSAAHAIIYSKEEAGFYKALSRSLKKFGGKSPVQVTFAAALTPAVTLTTIQAAAAPTYEESGLGIWLDRIQDSGGKVCRKQYASSGLVGVILPFVVQFFAKTVVPFLISKYNAATAYLPAKKMNAIVVYDPRDSAQGRIIEIDFVPRSGADPCPSL